MPFFDEQEEGQGLILASAPANECSVHRKWVSVEAQLNTSKLARFITGFKDWASSSFRKLVTRSERDRNADRKQSKPKSHEKCRSYAKPAHPPLSAVEPPERPLFRNAPVTLRALTAYWIDELLASDERIRQAAAEVEGFMEVLQLAHSSQAPSEDDANVVLIVEHFQSVLSHAFGVELGRQSNV